MNETLHLRCHTVIPLVTTIALLLTVVAILLCSANFSDDSVADASGTDGGISWRVEYDALTETNVLTISKSDSPESTYGAGVMKDYDYSIESSRTMAPWNNLVFDSVVIEDGVTNIGQYAFYGCTTIRSVTISASVPSIEWTMFKWCTNLHSITITGSVTSIGNYALSDLKYLSSVTASGSVNTIGFAVFDGCNGLLSVGFNFSGDDAAIGDSAFSGCTSLYNVNLTGSLKTIGESAFSGCTDLEEIIIPDSVTTIGTYAFYGCTQLVDVGIPDSVTYIGYSAFANCTDLSTIEVSAQNTKYSSEDGVLFNYKKTALLQYPAGKIGSTYAIPSTVTNILNGAFTMCSNLKEVTIGSNVKTIGPNAFYGCTGLKSIVIADSVTSIGDSAFSGCTDLKSVVIGSKVKTIGDSAFYECTDLESINIPDTVTAINDSTFCYCYSLGSISIPDTVTSVGNYAFYSCNNLSVLTIGSSVKTIGYSAFAECESLTCIIIPDSVTSIDYSAFNGCTSLKSVTVGTGLTSIESDVFGDLVFHGSGSGAGGVLSPITAKKLRGFTFHDCEASTLKKGVVHTYTFVPEVYACDHDGVKEHYECTACNSYFVKSGDDYVQVTKSSLLVPMTGHSMVQTPYKDATGTEAGTEGYYTCGNCHGVFEDADGTKETTVDDRKIDAKGHSKGSHYGAHDATCTEAGNVEYWVCANGCGSDIDDALKVVSDVTIPAKGHSMVQTPYKDATCTEAGTEGYYTCGNCHGVFEDAEGTKGTTVDDRKIDAKGHSYGDMIQETPATCTAVGIMAHYECSVCNALFTNDKTQVPLKDLVISSKGHSYGDLIREVPATSIRDGTKAHYECSVCLALFTKTGEEYTQVEASSLVIPATGSSSGSTDINVAAVAAASIVLVLSIVAMASVIRRSA